MRPLTILLLPVALVGCLHRDFATAASSYNSYPGSFERARYLAHEARDADMLAALDALGASRDHDGFTAKLATCMDARLSAARWQRQSEVGDALTATTVQAEASSPDRYIREAALSDKAHIDEPEPTWKATAQFCIEQCGAVAAASGASLRDRNYATTYLAACKTSVAAAEPAQHRSFDRKALAGVAHALQLARDAEAKRCFVGEAWFLDDAGKMLGRVPTSDAAVALRDQIATARAAHSGELARADRFNHDPDVVELERREARLSNRLGAAQGESRDTGEMTATEQSELVGSEAELQADLRDVRATLDARVHAAGMQCAISDTAGR